MPNTETAPFDSGLCQVWQWIQDKLFMANLHIDAHMVSHFSDWKTPMRQRNQFNENITIFGSKLCDEKWCLKFVQRWQKYESCCSEYAYAVKKQQQKRPLKAMPHRHNACLWRDFYVHAQAFFSPAAIMENGTNSFTLKSRWMWNFYRIFSHFEWIFGIFTWKRVSN